MSRTDYSNRVGIVVPCDQTASVTDETVTQAQRKAAEHLGCPVDLVAREGMVYAGPTTHLTFEATP